MNNNPFRNFQYRPVYSKVDELILSSPNFNHPFIKREISQCIQTDIDKGYCPLLEWLYLYPDRVIQLPQPFRDGLTDAYGQIYKSSTKIPLEKIIELLHSALLHNLENARANNYSLPPMQYITFEYYRTAVNTEQNSTELLNQLQTLKNELQDLETELTIMQTKLRTAEERESNLQNNLRQAREDRNAAEQERNDIIVRYTTMTEIFEKDKPRLIEEALEKRWEEYRAEREAELEYRLREEENRCMEEIHRQAEEESARLVDERLKDYLEEEHSGWNRFRDEVNAAYDEQSAALSTAKKDACDESARMQREMKKYMEEYMVNFCTKLDAWRNSVYDVEVKEFAQWYTTFYAFVDKLDYRIANELNNEAVDALQKIARYLKNLRKRLESVVLPKMGLRPFSPQKNDPFDSVLHEQKQYDDAYDEDYSEDIVPEKLVVRRCVTPGVEKIMADREMLNILVKAEVEAVTSDVLAAEDAKHTAENTVPDTAEVPTFSDRLKPVISSEEVPNDDGEIVDRTGL